MGVDDDLFIDMEIFYVYVDEWQTPIIIIDRSIANDSDRHLFMVLLFASLVEI